MDSSSAYDHLQLAALLVETGDLEAYRAHCRRMLTRFDGANDAIIADQTAKACLLVPGAAGDLAVADGESEGGLGVKPSVVGLAPSRSTDRRAEPSGVSLPRRF